MCSRSVKAAHEPLHRNNTRKVAQDRIEIQFVENMAEKGSLRLRTNKGVRFEVGGEEEDATMIWLLARPNSDVAADAAKRLIAFAEQQGVECRTLAESRSTSSR